VSASVERVKAPNATVVQPDQEKHPKEDRYPQFFSTFSPNLSCISIRPGCWPRTACSYSAYGSACCLGGDDVSAAHVQARAAGERHRAAQHATPHGPTLFFMTSSSSLGASCSVPVLRAGGASGAGGGAASTEPRDGGAAVASWVVSCFSALPALAAALTVLEDMWSDDDVTVLLYVCIRYAVLPRLCCVLVAAAVATGQLPGVSTADRPA